MHLLGSFKRFVQHFSTVYTCDFCLTNSMQFCRAEVATGGDFVAFLVQFSTLSVNTSTSLFRKQKLSGSLKVKLPGCYFRLKYWKNV